MFLVCCRDEDAVGPGAGRHLAVVDAPDRMRAEDPAARTQ